ncbi:MAG: PH domain-containing protein [Desulfobacteraceae bacterium]
MPRRFALASMSPLILAITLILIAIPIIFITGAVASRRMLLAPAFFLLVIYLWVWLRFRPRQFVIHGTDLELIWPLKRQRFPRSTITVVEIIDRKKLRSMVGWGVRIGAGGLWGGFGWLWTRQRGIVCIYVSRIDEFVWIERRSERPLLITPDHMDDFVSALAVRPSPAKKHQ